MSGEVRVVCDTGEVLVGPMVVDDEPVDPLRMALDLVPHFEVWIKTAQEAGTSLSVRVDASTPVVEPALSEGEAHEAA